MPEHWRLWSLVSPQCSRSSSAGVASSALVALCWLAWSTDVHAHAGVPRAFEILVAPDDAARIVVRSDVWGFFHSENGGRSFQWSCAEVYGGRTTTSSYANFVVPRASRGGGLVVSLGYRGVRYTTDFCDWGTATGLNDEVVAAVADAGDRLLAVTTAGRDGGLENTLYRSDDVGRSFTRTDAAFPGGVAVHSFVFAPSDVGSAARAYVAGTDFVTGDGAFFRSTDGGVTYARRALPVTPDGRAAVRVAAIHPSRPDVVVVRLDHVEGLGEDVADALWLTRDGGDTWTSLLHGRGDLPGVTFTPDGTELYVAGPVDGLLRANVDTYALAPLSDAPHWGLLATEAGLYAGTEQFAPPALFTLGLSTDGGRTFAPVMRTCDVGYERCAAGSYQRRSCDGSWNEPYLGGFEEDFIDALPQCRTTPPDAGVVDAGTSDAGVPPVTTTASSGGCDVAGKPRSPFAALAVLVAAATALVRCRARAFVSELGE